MITYILFIVGMFLLVRGAKYLVDGSSSLAKLFGIKPMLVGMTVLAFGTSLPELAINIFASIKGTADITLGNIMGANIANILLILGISSIIITIKIKHHVVQKGIPFLIFSSSLILLLVNDSLFGGNSSILSRIDGILLLIFFTIFIIYLYSINTKVKKEAPKELKASRHSKSITLLMIFVGIIFLFIGGKLVVDNAIEIAKQLGVSTFLISATIISIGSTLPELMVSIVSALRKKLDFVVGNVVGSNIFNSLFILGIASLIRPIPFNPLFNFDLIFLFITVSIFLLFMYLGKKYQLERWNSIAFLVLYAFYLTFIIARG